jgi:hypothetical protein
VNSELRTIINCLICSDILMMDTICETAEEMLSFVLKDEIKWDHNVRPNPNISDPDCNYIEFKTLWQITKGDDESTVDFCHVVEIPLIAIVTALNLRYENDRDSWWMPISYEVFKQVYHEIQTSGGSK